MMGRGFYSPLHSMWGATFGAAAKHYPSAFPYAAVGNNGIAAKEEDEGGASNADAYGANQSLLSNGASISDPGASFGCPSSPSSTVGNDFAKIPDQHHQYAAAGLAYGLPTTSVHQHIPSSSSRKMQEGTTSSTPFSYYAAAATSVYGLGCTYPSSSPATAARSRPKHKGNAGKMEIGNGGEGS